MLSAWLSLREHRDYQVATLCGELDANDAEAVRTALAAAVARNPRMVVDLTWLEFIDCCALGVLARVRAQARRDGGDLLLAAPGPAVLRTVALAAMTAEFAFRASAAEAVRGSGWTGARSRRPRASAIAPSR